MDENLHNIDDLFKNAINGHEEMPSQNVWEQIDKNLDKKKVDFISGKYNKLKWVAAALLIFSAGMAAYTWKTKLHDKELVKIDNTKKENGKVRIKKQSNKKEEIVLNHTENTLGKDTISKTAQNIASQFKKANEGFNQNQKKSLIENKNINSKTHGNEYVRDSFKKNKKAKTNIKSTRQAEELLVKHEGISTEEKAGRRITPGNKKSKSFVDEQKNSITVNLQVKGESLNKEIALKTELEKQNFDIETADASLQRVLPSLRINNRIISKEKGSFSVKRSKAKNRAKNPFFLTVFYSPDFVSSKINNNHHSFREDDRHEIKKNEKIKSSYTTGFLFDYTTSKNFTVGFGLTFSSMTTDIRPKKIYARPDNRGNVNYRFNCSAGYSYIPAKSGNLVAGDSIRAYSSKNILEYIGLPFYVKYNVTKGRFSFNPALGIAINFLVKGKIETAIARISGPEKANINHIEGLRQTYLNGALSLGVNYNLNQTLALNFTPATKFALTSINKDAPVKTYLNSGGLAAGLTIKL